MTSRPTTRLHTIDQIVDMMRARLEDLIAGPWALRGHRDGRDFVCPSPLRADRHAGSFRVCLSGSYRGMVKDFASGETWTPLSFTAALMFGGDNGQALRWARAWLGLDGTDPAAIRQTRAAVERAAALSDDDEGAEKNRALAHRRYLEAVADIRDTPVDGYLLGRGLDVRRLPFPLGALRFHPNLYNAESKRRWPAMVAAIVGADGKFLALHRTWLEVRGGIVVKAPLDTPKKALGSYRGGTIRLWAGINVDRETGEIRKAPPMRTAPAGTGVDITEGIEDGLSVAIAVTEARVLVGVSLSNMGGIALPACVTDVTLWGQNDPPGSPAERQFARVVEHFIGQGRRVSVARPPDGFKDPNEWVQKMAQQEHEARHAGG